MIIDKYFHLYGRKDDIVFEEITAPERMTTEWIPHPTEREWDVCGHCGIGVRRREYGLNEDGKEWVSEVSYMFCPWCGARMEVKS